MTSYPTAKTIVITTTISVLIAMIVLIGAVLPAEFGIDPLGTGKKLGLLDLYVADTTLAASTAQTTDYINHTIEIPLSPFESMEFKYYLKSGAGMVYNWHASGEVLFDFHGEADDAKPGEASFYESGRKRGSSGTFIAPFTGKHGWFWENRGTEVISIRLTTAGHYHHGIEYRDRSIQQHAIGTAN